VGVTVTATPFLAPRRARGPLAQADGRVVLLLALLFGVLVWRAGLAANVLYAAFFAAVLASAGASGQDARRLVRAAAAFALAWGGVKLAVDLLGGAAPREAGAAVALLVVRLAVLLLLGGVVSALLTPRALGLALAGLTPGFLRRRTWSVSLALLLMVHFVPRALAAFEGARAALRVRRVALPRLAGLVLVLEAGARNLARLTWDETLAVAARRLDAPEAWVEPVPLRLAHWGAGGAVALLAGAAAVLL
jgi:biotin transport system permease protein